MAEGRQYNCRPNRSVFPLFTPQEQP